MGIREAKEYVERTQASRVCGYLFEKRAPWASWLRE